MSERKARRNVFSNREFMLVFLGSLVSDLGSVIYSFVVSFYILEISGNNAALQGLYLATGSVVLLIATMFGGVLCDRYDKVRIMYLCDFIKGGTIFLSAAGMMIFPEHGTHLVLLFVCGIMGNIAGGFFSPAATALLPEIVEEQLLQQANATLSMKSSAQSIMGVIIAGILYGILPANVLFTLVGRCYVISGISELFVRRRHTASEGQLTMKTVIQDLITGRNYLTKQKAMQAIIIASLFINFFFTPFTSNFIPYFIKTDLSEAGSYMFSSVMKPEMWSSVISVLFGVSSLAGALILAVRPQKEKCGRVIVAALSVMASMLLIITVSYWMDVVKGYSINRFLIILSIGCFAAGMATMFTNIPLNTTLMKLVDSDKLGKVSGILSVISMGLIPIASAGAGIVLQYMGSTLLLAVCSAGFVLTVLFLLMNKEIKEI